MARDDDDGYGDGGYDDGYPKDEDRHERAATPVPMFRIAFGGAVDPRVVQAAINECQRRLGGKNGETAYVDYLKTLMAENYKLLHFNDRVRECRKEVGEELWAQLVGTPNLKWAMKSWNYDRMMKAYDAALDEAVKRINRDDPDLPRHTVEVWFKSNICLCARCWTG